jgi:hypothetical protein
LAVRRKLKKEQWPSATGFFAVWSPWVEGNMAKKAISSAELIWIFQEKIKEFDDCPGHGLSIAVVPMPDVGWSALISPRQRTTHPLCAKRVEMIQKQLREMYVLRG